MNHTHLRAWVVFTASGLLAASHVVHAQTFFPNSAVVTNSTLGDAVAGYANTSYTNPTSPTITFSSGGTVSGFLHVYNGSRVNLDGGSVGTNLISYDVSTVQMTAGNIGGTLGASDNSIISSTGGSVSGDLYTYVNSTVSIRGDSIAGILVLTDSSTVNFYGSNLSSVIISPNYNGLTQYALSGTLTDGTSLGGKQLYTVNGKNARFTLTSTPEPSALSAWEVGVLSLGFIGLCARRRAGSTEAAAAT